MHVGLYTGAIPRKLQDPSVHLGLFMQFLENDKTYRFTYVFYLQRLKPDIGKHPLDCSRHLYDARLINYRAI